MNYNNKIWRRLLLLAFVVLTGCSDNKLSEVPVEPNTPKSGYEKDGLLIKPLSTIDGNNAVLEAAIINNPYQEPLEFLWEANHSNPAFSEIENPQNAVTSVVIPDTPGAYFYDLLVVSAEDSARFQTLVTRGEDQLMAFDIDSHSSPWMEDAVIYEVTPYTFVANGTFRDITSKLAEIKELGANTLWLQPVYKVSYEGQGYNVIDYFSLNPALGTEADLQQLVSTAKNLNMRVLFDIPLSQTSIEHPYAKDVLAKGEDSRYFDYYQHEKLGNPYSSLIYEDASGFLHYFWEHLVILNYQNEEVQRWMLEACKYWVERFDIDGYRFDAIWGVNARMPSFGRRLRSELKAIKPDLLLLAEDKGADPQVYDQGFDAAYDWTSDQTWVSQWMWEYEYDENESRTIFNHPDVTRRGDLLRNALFQNEQPQFRLLRFLENNDLPRFISGHGAERTKMAAALVFALPGIPMLYNGQEIGFRGHPYTSDAILNRNSTIRAQDNSNLFPYYENLIELHLGYPALSGDNAMEEVPVSPQEALVAFRRYKENQNFIILINMDSEAATATLGLHEVLEGLRFEGKVELKDVLTDATFYPGEDASKVKIMMEGYSTRYLLLGPANE